MAVHSLKARILYTLLAFVGVFLLLRLLHRGYSYLMFALVCYGYVVSVVAAFGWPTSRFSLWFLAPENYEQCSEARWRARRRSDLWLGAGVFALAVTQTVLAVGEFSTGAESQPEWVSVSRDVSTLLFFVVMFAAFTIKWREA
jgi:hypothetical protein